VDGLLLPAELSAQASRVQVFDGEDSFLLEATEALLYELVSATKEERIRLEQAHYRLLRYAADFEPADRSF
jgi:hypothetical protein